MAQPGDKRFQKVIFENMAEKRPLKNKKNKIGKNAFLTLNEGSESVIVDTTMANMSHSQSSEPAREETSGLQGMLYRKKALSLTQATPGFASKEKTPASSSGATVSSSGTSVVSSGSIPLQLDLKRRFERSFYCLDCGRAFSSGGLKRHRRLIHTEEGRLMNKARSEKLKLLALK